MHNSNYEPVKYMGIMEPKKSKKADLENKKSLFLEIGLIFAVGLVMAAFNWTSRPKNIEGYQNQDDSKIVQENVPITRRKEEKPPPPPPPQAIEMIKIVENDIHIEDELRLEETGADEDTRVQIDAFSEKEESEDEQQPFIVVEDPPKFQGGGINAFRKYVQENANYPTVASENGIEGKVYINFVINRDGSISDINIVRSVDPVLDKEAKSVVATAPDWEPGKQRGKAVRVKYTIPVVFVLSGDE